MKSSNDPYLMIIKCVYVPYSLEIFFNILLAHFFDLKWPHWCQKCLWNMFPVSHPFLCLSVKNALWTRIKLGCTAPPSDTLPNLSNHDVRWKLTQISADVELSSNCFVTTIALYLNLDVQAGERWNQVNPTLVFCVLVISVLAVQKKVGASRKAVTDRIEISASWSVRTVLVQSPHP